MKNVILCCVAMCFVCLLVSNTALAQETHPERTSLGNRDFNKPHGYTGLVDLNFGASVNGYKSVPVSITMINGYRFMPQFAMGFGTGVELIGKHFVVPVFLHLRSDILDNWLSPYVAFNMGYSISPSTDIYKGVMVEPSIGVGFNAGTHSRVNIGLFCAMKNMRVYEIRDPYDHSYNHLSYNVVPNCVMGLKVGMSF